MGKVPITIALQRWRYLGIWHLSLDWGRFSLFYLQSHHLYGFMYSLTWTIWPLLKVIIILVMMLIMAITRWSWRRWLRGSQRRVQQTSSCTTKRMQVVKITTKVFLKRKYKEKYNKYKYKYNKEDAGSEHLFFKNIGLNYCSKKNSRKIIKKIVMVGPQRCWGSFHVQISLCSNNIMYSEVTIIRWRCWQ